MQGKDKAVMRARGKEGATRPVGMAWENGKNSGRGVGKGGRQPSTQVGFGRGPVAQNGVITPTLHIFV